MDRARLVRRLGDLAPIIGALAAATSLVSSAYYVDRSGCTSSEFECIAPTVEAAASALILCVPVAIGALWLAALTTADDNAAMRRGGPALWRAIGGGIAWVLLTLPATWLLVKSSPTALSTAAERRI